MEFDVFTLKFNDSGDGLGLKLANDDLDCSINLENEDITDLKDFFDKILFSIIVFLLSRSIYFSSLIKKNLVLYEGE